MKLSIRKQQWPTNKLGASNIRFFEEDVPTKTQYVVGSPRDITLIRQNYRILGELQFKDDISPKEAAVYTKKIREALKK